MVTNNSRRMTVSKNVMDVLNLWKDDPEEILLELGFGCDEPDLSGRIPARFINYKSKARGISLQVFLDAQRNRIDLENPDVSNRFRQVEVLQQVTTALCGLVVSSNPSSLRAPSEKMLSPEARERRRRMASLFRRASKKSLNQNHAPKNQDVTTTAPVTSDSATPESLQPAAGLAENVPVQRVETGQLEIGRLSPVTDERENNPRLIIQPHPDQKQELRPGHLGKVGSAVKASAMFKRKSLGDCAPPDTKKALLGDNRRSAMSDTSPSPQMDSSFHLPLTTSDPLCVKTSPSNFDKPPSQMEMTHNQVQPPPALGSESTTEHLILRSSSPELQKNSECQLPYCSSPTVSHSFPSSHIHMAQEPRRLSKSEAVEASLPHLSDNDCQGLYLCSNATLLAKEPNSLEEPINPPLQLAKPDIAPAPCLPFQESSTAEKDHPTLSYLSCNTDKNNTKVSLHPDDDIPLASNVPVLDSSRFQDDCPTLPSPSGHTVLSDKSWLSEKNNHPSFQLDKDFHSATRPSALECNGVCPTRTVASCESVDLKKPNSPTHQVNTHIHSSPSSPVSGGTSLSCLSHDTVLSNGSDLLEPPTNLPHQLDNDIPSEPYHSSLGSSKLEDNVSTPTGLSYGKVSLGSGLTDKPTNLSLEPDKNISFSPTTPNPEASNFSKDCPYLSNGSVNSFESSLVKKNISPYFQLDNDSPSAGSTPVLDPLRIKDKCSTVSNESDLSDKSITSPPHLNKEKPSALKNSTADPSKYEDDCPILSCPSSETLDPVCPPAVTYLKSNLEPQPRDVTEEEKSDLTEESSNNEDQSSLLKDNIDPIPSSVRDVNNERVDWLIIEPVNTRESHEKAVCFSDTNHSPSVGKTIETETSIISSCIHDEVLDETNQRRSNEINDAGNQSRGINELPMIGSRTDETSTDLMEMESLNVVFDTSVDGFESENGDMDEFLQQLDNEGRVYWAEPILVSDSSYTLKETNTFSESPRDSVLSRSSVSLDSFLSPTLPSINQTTEDHMFLVDTSTVVGEPVPSQSIIPGFKRTSRSVSVQMSSSPSSHIVHRKDIPYVTDSKPTPLPRGFSLDTSSPLRAVQSWTDLQIQRRNKKLPDRALTLPHEADVPEGTAGKAHRSMMVYSSSPSFPLLPNHSQLQDSLPGIARNYRTVSVSVDTGLGPDREEEMYRRGNAKNHLWEGNRSVSVACCCSCDHERHYCADGGYTKQHTLENSPYSLGDLEEMMLWLQQYCSVHSNMEEELSENRASVYSSLSDLDREKIEDLEALRQAVKLEAVELEAQLKQLAHHSDDSLKMKMRRLLDEQSLMCTQLRVSRPAAVDVSSSKSTPSRAVATQCSLQPGASSADMQSLTTNHAG